MTLDKTIDNDCPIITMANRKQEGTISVASTSNQASDHRSMNVSRASEPVCVATMYGMKRIV